MRQRCLTGDCSHTANKTGKRQELKGSKAAKTLSYQSWYSDFGEMKHEALIGEIPIVPMISARRAKRAHFKLYSEQGRFFFWTRE